MIRRLEDLHEDAQARAAGAVVETEIDSMPLTLAAPIRIGDVKPRVAKRAPTLGEHTDEILAEAGYDGAAIAALRKAGALS